jgi:enediyne biosynthesis protein E3
MGTLSRRVLGIEPRETSFARRGFRCDSTAVRLRLEGVGTNFVRGYHLALETRDCDLLAARIAAEVEPDSAGFAFEGAAMALTLLDTLVPWRRRRLQRLLDGPGSAHVYIVHVGAGWALARLPVPVGRFLARLDPLLGWLALDGYGFHQGFFHSPRAVARQEVPRRVRGYARRAFDQGLGRSLWFVDGADPARIAAEIAAFPQARRADLWSGVGLACAYAGGLGRAAIAELRLLAGPYRPELAQGVAFAVTARLLAGNPTPDTTLACAEVCGLTLEQAAAVTDRAMPRGAGGSMESPAMAATATAANAPAVAPDLPAFELWRQQIQRTFLSEVASA